MPGLIKKRDGFTLIEIMVALAISGIVMAGIYSAYYSQQKSYVAQGEVTKMQQNLRAAMYFMEREIRMAGCDPKESTGAGITNLGWEETLGRYTSITFTEDISDGSGGNPNGALEANETITYALNGSNLERNGTTISQNIEILDFVYMDGNNPPAPTSNLNDIRSVQITLIARTDRGDLGYVNSEVYQNQQGTNLSTSSVNYPANDNFRRRICTAQVKCRNLGL